MKHPFFYAAVQGMPELFFIPFYVCTIIYLVRILLRYKTNKYLQKLLISMVSLGCLLLVPKDNMDILIVKYCLFTTPFLLIIYQRIGIIGSSMRLFIIFIVALWCLEIFFGLIWYFNFIDVGLYKYIYILMVTFLNVSLAVYFIYMCTRKAREFIAGITPKFFKYILSGFGIIILLMHIVLFTIVYGYGWYLFFLTFSTLFSVQVLFVYSECKSAGHNDYPIPKEDYYCEVLEDVSVSDESLIIHRLIRVFEQEKLFLNPKITVAEVANKIYTNRTYLSRALNHRTSKNFNQFVNYYRTKEVCELFIQNPHLDIKHLRERCGFNSFSSFSSSFKINTGYTPVEWSRLVNERLLNHEKITVHDYFL